jgi:anti-sigma factor RsiW
MMFRGDLHVDDWAEVAVDYLDGRLDERTRLAVESHLAGCPDCAARLRTQQSVVRFLQETPLDDPPEDLEYRAIGKIIFPSPGGQSFVRPVVKKPSRSPRWTRTLRAWLPVTVAVIALLGAVIGYGISRSGSGTQVASDTDRAVAGITTVAASMTTAAPSVGQVTMAGAAATVTTAAAATTTTAALAAGPPATETAPVT